MRKRTAAEFMSTTVITVTDHLRITDVISRMLEHNVSCLPVVNADALLIGIITEYDVLNLAYSGEADRTTVGEVMTRDVITFQPGDDLATVVNACLERRIHRAPVVKDGKMLGIISRRDILREMLKEYSHH
jgi:CBS domain-containing protein